MLKGRGGGAARIAALAAAMLALTTAGCGGSGADGTGGAAGKVLKLWHYEGPDSAMGVAWAQAIKRFEATHPGVKVKFEERGFEEIQKTAPMVLNSREAPDLMEYNKGNATAGLLSRQGLLTDMSAEVAKRGWDKLLAANIQTTSRYDAAGVMGSGKWYGVPNYAEYVLVFYNKDMFDEQGLKVPGTFEEFTAAMDKFAKAGITPLAVGGKEYPAQQYLYQLALSRANRAWVDAYQRYTGQVNFRDPAWMHAATTFADWVRKGYIDKKSAGVDAEGMGTAFIAGKFPIMVSGSWWYGRLQKEIKKFEWGSFLWPGNTMNAGSGGNIWVVPQNSKNKGLAYDFIDITMSKEIQNILANNGGVPVAADPAAVTDAKSKQLIDNFNALARRDALAFYPDWPAPGYYDVLVAGVQKLINGSSPPHQVLDGLARPYNEHRTDIGR
jgi:raffinose/stachyose/melibiose transport system substrate-binding protein